MSRREQPSRGGYTSFAQIASKPPGIQGFQKEALQCLRKKNLTGRTTQNDRRYVEKISNVLGSNPFVDVETIFPGIRTSKKQCLKQFIEKWNKRDEKREDQVHTELIQVPFIRQGSKSESIRFPIGGGEILPRMQRNPQRKQVQQQQNPVRPLSYYDRLIIHLTPAEKLYLDKSQQSAYKELLKEGVPPVQIAPGQWIQDTSISFGIEHQDENLLMKCLNRRSNIFSSVFTSQHSTIKETIERIFDQAWRDNQLLPHPTTILPSLHYRPSKQVSQCIGLYIRYCSVLFIQLKIRQVYPALDDKEKKTADELIASLNEKMRDIKHRIGLLSG